MKIKQYSNVLDKPLSKGKQEVSLSAFSFLFSELVQYNQTQVDNIAELERRLEDAGYSIGARVLELLCHREKGNRRETRLLGILSFVHSTVWKVLFGKVADSLEKGTENEDEYMISEKELLVNRFISIPKDMGTFNCGAFVAGIVRGVLDSAGFPAVVTAHFVPVEGQQRPRTTILIKFAEEVSIQLLTRFMLYLGEKQDWVEFLAHSCVTFLNLDSIHMVMMENLAAAK
ncbi:trafficking protein particle complex subunit 5-like isoform X1 [Rhodamnia argentea]|uniref:Trafficking protein particle complex subunit 5-like isoform X1 n=1 Tax=Rhodamnia argentea TaxID=178133 RepID=A0ABM3HCE0_9MYRT|nr:trafficking protein particle complex subunit 5-like isoform X1 [Rhodamnia argentea]